MIAHTTKSTTVGNLAPLLQRLLARILDFWVFFMIPAIILGNVFRDMGRELVALMLLVYIFNVAFLPYWFNGQSLGKRVMKIKIISVNGSKPGLIVFVIRQILLELTAIAPILFIAGLLSEKRQFLHDMAVGTVVID